MARKEKLTLDYFPHYAVQGDISKIIQERYGNDGYAVLYKNYEEFCLRDRQYIDLSEYTALASISAYCKIPEEKYLEIVDLLVKLGAYDKDIWEKCKILVSETFIENTKDAYTKRKGEKIDFVSLKDFFLQKYRSKCISDAGNTQSKLKETKLKEIKEKVVVENNQKIEIVSSNDSEKTEIVSGNQATTTTNFSKPTLDEVRVYAAERGNKANPDKFHAHYEGKGWEINGELMRDWKAAFRYWEQNERKDNKLNAIESIPPSSRPDCQLYQKPDFSNAVSPDEVNSVIFQQWREKAKKRV